MRWILTQRYTRAALIGLPIPICNVFWPPGKHAHVGWPWGLGALVHGGGVAYSGAHRSACACGLALAQEGKGHHVQVDIGGVP